MATLAALAALAEPGSLCRSSSQLILSALNHEEQTQPDLNFAVDIRKATISLRAQVISATL